MNSIQRGDMVHSPSMTTFYIFLGVATISHFRGVSYDVAYIQKAIFLNEAGASKLIGFEPLSTADFTMASKIEFTSILTRCTATPAAMPDVKFSIVEEFLPSLIDQYISTITVAEHMSK